MTGPEIALVLLARAAAVGSGLIFLTAGIEKLRHRRVLPGVIANYRLLPRPLVAPVAAALPGLEIALGLLLLSGLSALGSVVGAGLLVVFAGAMAANLLRGRREICCGCGRLDLRQRLRWTSVVRNLVLAVVLLGAVAPLGPLPLFASASAAFCGVAIWLANLLFETIGAIGAPDLSAHRSH